MLGKTHKYVGTCCGILAAEQLIISNIDSINMNNMIVSGMLISGSIFGSLALDIDKVESKAGHKFPLLAKIISNLCGHRGITHTPLLWLLLCSLFIFLGYNMQENHLILITCILSCFIFYELSLTLIKIFTKNKILKPLFSLIIGISITYILYNQGITLIQTSYNYIIIGIFIGALSHVFLDFFNPMGVPLLFPIKRRKYRFLKVSEAAGPIFSFIFTILVLLNTINIYMGGSLWEII